MTYTWVQEKDRTLKVLAYQENAFETYRLKFPNLGSATF